MAEPIETTVEKPEVMVGMKVAHVCRKCDRVFRDEYIEKVTHVEFQKANAVDPEHYYMNGSSSDDHAKVPYRRTIDDESCGFC